MQQQQIVAAVEQGAARKAFDLSLPDLGPYSVAYTRAGRHMLLGGVRGHLAMMEWQRQHLTCEVQVGAFLVQTHMSHVTLCHVVLCDSYRQYYATAGLCPGS